MDWSIAKIFLNTLKCPICKSRLDLYEAKESSRKYNFCCSANWEHYRIFFIHWEAVLRVEYETIVVYEGKHKYHLTQYDDNRTELFVYAVDAENRILDTKEKKPFVGRYDKKLFDFTNTTKDKIVNRIKTILVFS